MGETPASWRTDPSFDLEWGYGGFLIKIPSARWNDQIAIHDVDVYDADGQHWFGYLTTTDMVLERLASYAETGENARGLYFEGSGIVIVRDMDLETLRRVVEDLIDRDLLNEVFYTVDQSGPPRLRKGGSGG